MSRRRTTRQMITIDDVAQEAGVSHATVSRVLNNSSYVDPDKRQRVIQAMAHLGYTANQQARSLAGGKSQVVGLLASDLINPYVNLIYQGIESELAGSQYDLLLYTTHRRKTKETAHVATLARGLADGLLIILPRNIEAYLDALHQSRFPYVLIDHQGKEGQSASVYMDFWPGAYEATSYLLALGHRRIGLITGAGLKAAEQRLEAYQTALTNRGVPIDPTLIQQGDFFQPSGFEKTQVLLALPEPPTAIIASNDVMALGVYEAVRKQGLRIPDDISVLGFDDIPQASYVHPRLTTMRQPLEQMGSVATRMLLDMIADPERPVAQVEMKAELIIRESCRRLP